MIASRPQTDVPASPATSWLAEHGDALFRYALLRVRAPDVAEDLVQETLLAALTARDRFTRSAGERTWLVGILKHKIFDHLRRRWRAKPFEGEFEPDGPVDPFTRGGKWKQRISAWRGGPAARMEGAEFAAVLAACLGKLPPRVAEVFWLRETDGLETEDLCQALSISATNVWSMLYRARSRLRRCLTVNWFDAAAQDGDVVAEQQ